MTTRKYKGEVSKFFGSKSYGFIKCDEVNDSIFFHISNFRDDISYIQSGVKVSFHLEETPKGYSATNIKLIE